MISSELQPIACFCETLRRRRDAGIAHKDITSDPNLKKRSRQHRQLAQDRRQIGLQNLNVAVSLAGLTQIACYSP
ncbi:hypothetical protein HYQ45_008886 [Verticillium longisporum]|uniref:Uncharacterized protein n=1 Tax=Verticillium longisporum TaxID=100787 RepID=A0A8I2ZJD1_VERLO|nr:hypothetical protein HYQ45_008886 [Verticillium longisporum]